MSDLCRDELGNKCPAKGKGAVACSKQNPCNYAVNMDKDKNINKSEYKLNLYDACMSYRHDFGLMEKEEQESLMVEAMMWFNVFNKLNKD